METEFKWDDDATVKDFTPQVRKIWDVELPKRIPQIVSVDTISVKEISGYELLGPHKVGKYAIKFKVIVNLNPQPIIDMGLYGKETLTINEFERAYGEKFDYELRNEMIRLLKYLGIFVSQFDFDGNLTYHM